MRFMIDANMPQSAIGALEARGIKSSLHGVLVSASLRTLGLRSVMKPRKIV